MCLGESSLKIDLMDWQGERRYAVYENFQLANEQVRNGESGDLLVVSVRVGHLHMPHQTSVIRVVIMALHNSPALVPWDSWCDKNSPGSRDVSLGRLFTTAERPSQRVTGSCVLALLLTVLLHRGQFSAAGHRDSHMDLPPASWLKVFREGGYTGLNFCKETEPCSPTS